MTITYASKAGDVRHEHRLRKNLVVLCIGSIWPIKVVFRLFLHQGCITHKHTAWIALTIFTVIIEMKQFLLYIFTAPIFDFEHCQTFYLFLPFMLDHFLGSTKEMPLINVNLSHVFRFMVNRRIFVVGFGLYGSIHGPSEYSVNIQVKNQISFIPYRPPRSKYMLCCSRLGYPLS